MKADEFQLRIQEEILKCRDDPLRFVLLVFPWGEKGTVLENYPLGPEDWHRELFAEIKLHCQANTGKRLRKLPQGNFQAAVKSGHGIGKSACVAWLILWLMSTRLNCKGVVTANTEAQLRTKTWMELKKWHGLALNKDWFNWTASSFQAVGNPDWRFDCIPWSENSTEGFAGLHNAGSSAVMIFDEASGIPDLLWEVAEGSQTDGEPFWFAFGNPTQSSGRFFQCFNYFAKRWKRFTVDSRTVRITENKQKINDWIEDYGLESDFVKTRVLGEFPSQGDNQFIPSELVFQAADRKAEVMPGDGLVIGVDVARFGSDKTVILAREGNKVISHKVYRDRDLMQTVGYVSEFINKYRPDRVMVDDCGLGGGVTDRLKQLGFNIIPVNAGSSADDKDAYGNKRAEMWARMKDWLKNADIPDDQDLKTDLITPFYYFDAKNRIMLEKKDDMKARGAKSPDLGDALALTFAYRQTFGGLRNMAKSSMMQEYVDSEYSMFG